MARFYNPKMARIGLLLLAWFATCAQADDTLLGAGVRSRPDYDGTAPARAPWT